MKNVLHQISEESHSWISGQTPKVRKEAGSDSSTEEGELSSESIAKFSHNALFVAR